jgi:hypothetical protein
MTERAEEQFVQSSGVPKKINEDRFTILVQGHYQEFETGQTTIARWAYDRLVPSENSAFQANIRVQPGTKTAIPIPMDCSKYELLLGHKAPQMLAKDGLLADQQKLNEIEVWDGEKMIQTVGLDRIAFGRYTGPLFVSSTRATAILHITAFPL